MTLALAATRLRSTPQASTSALDAAAIRAVAGEVTETNTPLPTPVTGEALGTAHPVRSLRARVEGSTVKAMALVGISGLPVLALQPSRCEGAYGGLTLAVAAATHT